MAGDLEEFLKRAAERRAQKQQQQAGARPEPKRRSEYTDSRRERQIRHYDDESIPVAEIVEEVNPLAEQQRRVEEAKRKAEAAKRKLAEQKKKLRSSPQPQPSAKPVTLEGTPADQLLQMLRSPGGVRQAFLLREILDRPEARW
ncbi:hypothetical protein FYK55_19890 [Roseiconus nitratireducens]|uniref:Uncharacterized protein n=1 Tax=Roseiconus nitratireducens TaxID=2605748 RepID=A0A5M6CZI7_9BACT|nr:hypothetical protein [Roseiconus nitratireducens]KAA5540658.1 hypothetical protein FYK55_19890 [Roseiconus nitratireducens]